MGAGHVGFTFDTGRLQHGTGTPTRCFKFETDAEAVTINADGPDLTYRDSARELALRGLHAARGFGFGKITLKITCRFKYSDRCSEVSCHSAVPFIH